MTGRLLCVVLLACGAGAPVSSPAPVTSGTPVTSVTSATPVTSGTPDLTPPALQLPATVRPTRNTVELTILPERDDFTGEITIDLAVTAPTAVIWLDATEIVVERAEVRAGNARIPASAVVPGKSYLGLRLARPLAPGPAQLVIAYRGVMRRGDGDGIYTVEDGGALYALTQFAATDARQAFPCVDEPSSKVPWQLTLHTRRALAAFANTPVLFERDEPGDMKAVRFAETPPLPSYLVAFAVGPFETVAAGASRSRAPIRVVVPRGHAGEAAEAARTIRPALDALEDYFGSPYPYAKLDVLSAPVLNFGAMENPGLILVRQSEMLARPGEHAGRFPSTITHEMSHQWFGNSVTFAWWDDTWLNESFASWLTGKIVARWQTADDAGARRVVYRDEALTSDSLEAARVIRQPIASADDIANVYDNITYGKGAAVLAMLEHWLGEDVFQAAIRRYLAHHAGGSATYADFVGEMSAAAQRDVRPVFDSFILQSGAPLVALELVCGDQVRVKLAQQRYAPSGSRIDPRRAWRLPVCVRWGTASQTGRACTMLDAPEGELVLDTHTCPSWVAPNAEGLGYYRSLPKGELLDKLIAHAGALALSERVGLLGDVDALAAGGALPARTTLALIEQLAGDRSHYVVEAAAGVLTALDDRVPDALHPRYERWLQRIYGARARQLGWQPRAGEDGDAQQQRSWLLWLVAGTGRDPQLGSQASALVARWLVDHVRLAQLDAALHVAARRGGPPLFEQLSAALAQATARDDRSRLLGALGAFTQPALAARARALLLEPALDLRESIELLHRQLGEPRTREAAYAFVVAHFDALAARLPARSRTQLTQAFVALCDDDRRAEVEAFFRPRIEAMDGGPRVMRQALESMALCAAARKAQAPSIAAFLAGR